MKIFIALCILVITLQTEGEAQCWFTGNSQGPSSKCGVPTTSDTGANTLTYRPSELSNAELASLKSYCVSRINEYRNGKAFTGGTFDSFADIGGNPSPLTERSFSNDCSDAQAIGDLVVNVNNGGGCAGGHHTAFECPSVGATRFGQNSCCGKGGLSWGSWNTAEHFTFQSVKGALDECLQQMWDEGLPSNVNSGGVTGHWENMRSTEFTHVSCGFGWVADGPAKGRIFMNQDFFNNAGTQEADECIGCVSPGPTLPPTLPPTLSPTSPTSSPASGDCSFTSDCVWDGTPGIIACNGACATPFSVIATYYLGTNGCQSSYYFGCSKLEFECGDCPATQGLDTLKQLQGVNVSLYPLIPPVQRTYEESSGSLVFLGFIPSILAINYVLS